MVAFSGMTSRTRKANGPNQDKISALIADAEAPKPDGLKLEPF
jgi:hypothetical protein